MAIPTKKNRNLLLIAMILAVSMTTIDQTIVALAADTIQNSLGVSRSVISWSINSYILATAAFFMLGGKLADVFGHKRMAIIGISIFALFSLLSGFTPAGEYAGAWLITMRALQGIGTALMFPAALGIVRNSFPINEQGRAAAKFFGITGAMTALGPILGGQLVLWDWRAIFWINIPIAIGALLILAFQKVPRTVTKRGIDWKGAILVALGMTILVGGLQQASNWGWDSGLTWVSIFLGIGLLVTFFILQRQSKTPLLNTSAFQSRGYSLSALATLFASIAFVPIFFFISVYAQVSLNLSAEQSGILLLEFFIGFVIGSNFGGHLFDKGGAKLPLILGGLIGAVGFSLWAAKLGMLDNGAGFLSSPQFWATVISGLGIGIMFSVASTDIANRSSKTAYGESTAVSQTLKNLGGALGLALLSTLLATQLTTGLTQSFQKLGAPESAAVGIANNISSASGSQSSEFTSLPPSVQEEFTQAVRVSYAQATQSVFYVMAGTMGVIFILGLFYPRQERNVSA